MKFTKNASLNLSINAIVILILAITMLGLGLGFMRNIFGSATSEFEKVGGTVQKQMIEQMKESNKIVDIDRPKVTIKKAGKDQTYLGFKNVQADSRYFGMLDPDSTTANLKSTLGVNMATYACTTTQCSASDQTNKNTCCCLDTSYKTTATTVKSGEVMVVPFNIQAHSSAPEGTCFFDIIVCESDTKSTVDNLAASTACPSGSTENHLELTVDVTV